MVLLLLEARQSVVPGLAAHGHAHVLCVARNILPVGSEPHDSVKLPQQLFVDLPVAQLPEQRPQCIRGLPQLCPALEKRCGLRCEAAALDDPASSQHPLPGAQDKAHEVGHIQPGLAAHVAGRDQLFGQVLQRVKLCRQQTLLLASVLVGLQLGVLEAVRLLVRGLCVKGLEARKSRRTQALLPLRRCNGRGHARSWPGVARSGRDRALVVGLGPLGLAVRGFLRPGPGCGLGL
mmetsp:Transcript_119890/g.374880  ORF Transcript_119890/g.374880 Transcript_119890/m.374880 type:complete len:234 (+) Transcript_119890:721-1422(+)